MSTHIENYEVQRVAVALLSYWRNHPAAKDSSRGIAQWWVAEDKDVVERALALLLKEGVIMKRGRLFQMAGSHIAQERSQPRTKPPRNGRAAGKNNESKSSARKDARPQN